MFKLFGLLGSFPVRIFAVLTDAWDAGVRALEDGVIDESEVEATALELSQNLGDVLVVKIQGHDIILIDDVYTTGATLHECAKVLHTTGAHTVRAVVAAQASQSTPA